MSGMTKSKSAFNIKVDLVDGDSATTNIPITGIATEDELIYVGRYVNKAAIGALTDITSDASITSAGNIQLATVDASAPDLLKVVWIDVSV